MEDSNNQETKVQKPNMIITNRIFKRIADTNNYTHENDWCLINPAKFDGALCRPCYKKESIKPIKKR